MQQEAFTFKALVAAHVSALNVCEFGGSVELITFLVMWRERKKQCKVHTSTELLTVTFYASGISIVISGHGALDHLLGLTVYK